MPSADFGRIDLGDVTPHNIKLLRKVNTVVFPVSYHDKFYKVRTVAAAADLSDRLGVLGRVRGRRACKACVLQRHSGGEARTPQLPLEALAV